MPPDRKFGHWRQDPSKLRAKVDRFGMSIGFASPKSEIAYNIQAPEGHELAIAAISPRGSVCGVTLDEWQKNAYGMRDAIERGLRLRERTTKTPIVLPPTLKY